MEDRELMEKELLLIKGASDLYLHGVSMHPKGCKCRSHTSYS